MFQGPEPNGLRLLKKMSQLLRLLLKFFKIIERVFVRAGEQRFERDMFIQRPEKVNHHLKFGERFFY